MGKIYKYEYTITYWRKDYEESNIFIVNIGFCVP